MMTRKRWTAAVAAVVGAAFLATAAAAGDGPGNPHGTPPGQVGKGTPPGQVGKGTPPGQARKQGKSAKGTARAEKGKSTSRVAKRETKHATPSGQSRSSAPALPQQARAGKTTICHRTGSETNPWVEITVSDNSLDAHRRHGDQVPAGTCPSGSQAQPGGANGQDKVTICHRTGSESNPFVVITIARAGWENGHSKHEGDRIIQPGETCTQAGAQAPAGAMPGTAPCPPAGSSGTEAGVWHKTGSSKNPYVFITPSQNSAHYDASKHPDDIIVAGMLGSVETLNANCGAVGAPNQGVAQTISGVAGVKATLRNPAAKQAEAAKAQRGQGGVLGATASLGNRVRGTLPYTGLSLWVVALAALLLISTGYALRRAHARVGR
jgi:hypothetical protein